MKLSLVVAQGVHTGKVIPVTAADFVIGRDPQCQLRPASPAVSKQHCALNVRDGKVYVRDCGSTNGTFINGEQVAAEREVKAGDRLRVGPLEFDLMIDTSAPAARPAPAQPAAAKAAPKPAAKPTAKPAAKPASANDTVTGAGTVVMDPPTAAPVEAARATTVVDPGPPSERDVDDQVAALLLGMEDGPAAPGTIEQLSADATTVMEMPALGADKTGDPKKDQKKVHEDSATAAAELLSKYMRRPRT
ncbi:MAG TPA: FHA domain-containing protein [Gemmataceae bacterium]|nr:FHA domain-containing protein [Gemmataceae bacterium]